nr:hypothetical protein [Natronoglycomyces albus]
MSLAPGGGERRVGAQSPRHFQLGAKPACGFGGIGRGDEVLHNTDEAMVGHCRHHVRGVLGGHGEK